MKVSDSKYVAIDYRLTLESGEEVDKSAQGQPLGFVAGTGRIIPGLENALYGKEAGESFRVTVKPDEGYGPVDESLFRQIPRDRFPEGADLSPGTLFVAQGPGGPRRLSVASVSGDTVLVDMNHPLAGKNLLFDVRVVEVRDARPEEFPPPVSGCGCGSGEESGSACGSGGGGCACGPEQQSACGCG